MGKCLHGLHYGLTFKRMMCNWILMVVDLYFKYAAFILVPKECFIK